eukprot:m.691248 g.691248  ORF g.691248 m.691248 type:complete len:248 (-) comp58639_c1_seq10:663-1406(-)
MSLVEQFPWLTWVLFVVFTGLHLFFNYKAVSSLVFDTLNDRRAHILAHHFMEKRKMLRPNAVAAIEPIFVFNTRRELPIVLGAKFPADITTVEELRVCASGSTGGYLLCVQRGASGPHAFHVVLRPDATAKDILHAYLFAFEFRQEILELLKQAKTEQWNEEILMAKIAGVRTTLARRAQSTFDDFVNAAELSGWRLHFLQMTVGPSRATWASVQDVHEQEAGSPSFKIKRWSSEQSLSGASQTSLV